MYKSLFQTTDMGVIFRNDKEKIISINPAGKKILGLDSNAILEILTKPYIINFYNEAHLKITEENLPGIMALRSNRHISDQILCIEIPELNQYTWIYASSVPQFDKGSKTRFSITTFSEITKSKMTEELIEYQENLKTLSRTALQLVEFPQDKNIYDFIGNQIREFIGNSGFIIVNSVDPKTRVSIIHTVLGMGPFVNKIIKLMGRNPVGMVFDVADRNIHYPDGKIHPYNEGIYGLVLKTVPKAICDSLEKLLNIEKIYVIDLAKHEQFFGSIVFLFKTGVELKNRNIIETFIKQASIAIQKNQAEQALRESEDKFRALFELSPVGMVMIDHKSGDFLEVNNAVLKSIGYTKEEFIALKCEDITPGKSEKIRAEQMESLNKTGRFGPDEKEFIKKDGSRYPIRLSGFLARSTIGRKVIWEIIEDISENKRMEKEKLDLLLQLNHKSKMDAIGELAGGIAHDFNNVLGGILSASQLLKLPKQGLNEKNLQYVDMIIQASISSSDLISKLLAFSRKGNIRTSTLDINVILNDVVAILGGTIDKRITISVTNDAPNHKFIGDRSVIESLFLNLGINASHAMPDGGGIQFTTKNTSLDQEYCDSSPFEMTPGEFLQIEIKDTGCGIPKGNLQKIFEPFYTTKEQGKGTGLGLSTVYGSIQDHHGSIEVHSEVGSGTIFHILFPSSEKPAEPGKEENPIVTGSGTILLVDDEEVNRILSQDILESLGYKVLLAENGLESIKIFSEKYTEIDIVLMDMIMPKMNGSEAFYKMKEIDKNCKVIITSGYTQDENIDSLTKNGLAGFINKPYKISEISRLLKDVLK